MTRTTLILMLTAALAAGLSAQETTTAPETAGTTTTVAAEAPATTTTAAEETLEAAANEEDAAETTTATTTDGSGKPRTLGVYEIRNHFTSLLQEHPPELGMILKLDPALLRNQQFISTWPQIAAFLERHPEVAQNGRFFLGNIPYPGTNNSVVDDIFEAIVFGLAWVLAIFALGWLIRTIVEQKRWTKLSKTQSEVHNKILDRFASSEELLDYVKTPAGSRFLEATPIQVQAEPAKNGGSTSAAPLTRIVWSIQLGVVAAVAGLGLLLVSLRFDADTSQGLFVIGGIVFCVGAGFIASALVSLTLSRRLGLWQGPPAPNDGGTVR